MSVQQSEAGLYNKFSVQRVDGRDRPGGDREDSEYFVLDLTHDPHALDALMAYAISLKRSGEYPELAAELMERYFDCTLPHTNGHPK